MTSAAKCGAVVSFLACLVATTLNDEVAILATPFGLDVPVIDEILLNGVRHSFLPAEQKARLEAAYRAELDALKAIHLRS